MGRYIVHSGLYIIRRPLGAHGCAAQRCQSCLLADPVKFAGISGRRWDWLTLLRWLEFVTLAVYFRDFQTHFGGFLAVSGS